LCKIEAFNKNDTANEVRPAGENGPTSFDGNRLGDVPRPRKSAGDAGRGQTCQRSIYFWRRGEVAGLFESAHSPLIVGALELDGEPSGICVLGITQEAICDGPTN